MSHHANPTSSTPRVVVLAATAVAILIALPARAEPALGRLFLTPEKREALNRQRAADTLHAQPEIEESWIHANGQVLRSSGRKTTWVNGQSYSETGRPSTRAETRPENVTVRPAGDATQTIRVGEALNRETQETRDVIGDGRIIVHGKPGTHPR